MCYVVEIVMFTLILNTNEFVSDVLATIKMSTERIRGPAVQFGDGDTTATDLEDRRKMNMIKTYSDGVGHVMCDNTMRNINRVIRCTIISKLKFVDVSNKFGSFNQPDFTNKKSWVSILLSNIPSMDATTDSMKCKLWMTYRHKIREQFSLHRSAVTLKIKRAFVRGKDNNV